MSNSDRTTEERPPRHLAFPPVKGGKPGSSENPNTSKQTVHPPELQRRTLLKLGATGALAASSLGGTPIAVMGQTGSSSMKNVTSQWLTAFNEGDIETLRSVYGDRPQNSLVPAGEPPREIDLVLSFNQVVHDMGTTIEIELEELSEIDSGSPGLRGPAILDTVPMGSLKGEADLKFEAAENAYFLSNIEISIPFDVLIESWGDPGELPSDAEPLTDMEPGETFQGRDGGLYGNYQNVPPLEHQQAAVNALNRVQPRDATGAPSEDGKIGFISLGPSNTYHYWAAFEKMTREDPETASYLWLFNGCEGTFSTDARAWSLGDYPASLLNYKLEKPELPREQVQVAWYTPHYYHDMQEPIEPLEYADDIHDYVREMVPKLKANFPNLEIVYLSGFPYLGYAKTGFGEPMAYEMNLAARSLIRSQIEGDSQLNYEADQDDGNAPLLLWGPYLWAKGDTPRSDGLTWSPGDYSEQDRAHPNEQGARKVAELLTEFFKANKFARSWFLDVEPPAEDDLETPEPVATPSPESTPTEDSPGFGPATALVGLGGAAAYRHYRNRESEK